MKKFLVAILVSTIFLFNSLVTEAKIIEVPSNAKFIGLLDEKELVNYLVDIPNLFDNNSNSYSWFPSGDMNNTLVTFNYPVYIDSVQMRYISPYSTITFTMLGGKTLELTFPNLQTADTIKQTIKLSDVTAINYVVKSSNVNNRIYEIDFFGSYDDEPKVYDKAHTLTAESTYNSIDLNWINPNLIGFENVLLYVNGELKDTLGTDVTNYQLTNLTPETSYQIELVAKYDDGGLSEKEILTVVTPKIEPELKEIQNLNAKATHERVDLSWNYPVAQETFKFVNIYRGLADEDFDRYNLNTVKPSSKTIKKIFETNGTYFNDLTVEPATTYDYKLSVTETNNNETEGILTRVTTAEKPAPEIKNPIIQKEGDDYIVTWTNDEGKVKIDVDGKNYTEVDASIKKLVIPAKDMKYDAFGKPLITITYTDKYGDSSKPTKPSQSGDGFENTELKLPFTIGTFLEVLMDLIKIVGPFILLSLAIAFTPKIINLIKKANNRKGNK